MIFATLDNNSDKWTAKIGILGKSLNELGVAVKNAFDATPSNGAKFWETLKEGLAPKNKDGKSWTRNAIGEIVSDKNIDSHIAKLDLASAEDKLSEILDIGEAVKSGNTTWDEYFDNLKDGGKEYIPELIKQTSDLSQLTAEDLVNANLKARDAAISHNQALKQQTLGAKAASAAMKLLSAAGNMIIMWAISEAISFAVKKFDELHVTVEESRENLENLKNDYSNLTSEIDSVNSELKTVGERLDILKNKGNLTFTEKEEYDNLVKQNNELQRQLDILETEAKVKNRQINTTFVETMEKEVGDINASDATITTTNGEIRDYLEQLNVLKGELANTKDPNMKKSIQADIDWVGEQLVGYSDQWTKNAEGVSYISNPTTKDDEKVNEWLDYIYDMQDKMAIAMDGKNAKTNAFNRLMDNWQFDDTVQNLQDLGKEGQVTASMLDDSKYDDFIDKLVEIGFIDSADNLNEIAQAFNNLSKEAYGASIELSNVSKVRTSMISSISDMSQGFGELDKIFASIKGTEPFDFTLLDNSQFKETFSGLESYSDFIESVTGNSDDIEACRSAFNSLIAEWIDSENILDDLTEENANLTKSMLKQMGIANADSVVNQALANNTQALSVDIKTLANNVALLEEKEAALALKEEALALTKEGVTESSIEKIKALLSEAGASNAVRAYLLNLVLTEQLYNNQNLDAAGKIEELEKLSKAYGLVGVSATIANMKQQAADAHVTYNPTNADWVNLQSQAQEEMKKMLSSELNTSIKFDYQGGDTSKALSDSKESFNWIEIALSRIQRTITNLGKTVSATYKSWGERNSALAKQMSEVNGEISTQQNAYSKYMQLAKGVKLGAFYENLVKSGSIKYDDKSIDSKTAEKIKKYQEYYEAALAAEDALIDLESEKYNLIQTNFDNIAKKYDDELSLIEHEANSLNSSIEMLEKQGQVVSEDYYHSLIQNANQQISKLQTKYRDLQGAMNGIAYGSEMWYSMNAELLAIEEEMKSLESSTIDWNNAIRDLEWENFDRALEKMAKVNEKADFLKELLSDEDMLNENGSITKEGLATMALHATNYNSKMEQANKINKELQILAQEYAGNEDNLTYLERRNKLEEQYQDLILDAKADEQSLIDMQKDQYDALLDYMSELIDKRKNMLSQAKDMYDYEKNIKEQAEEVAKLEKQLTAYQGDTSEESRATIQQIKVSLEEAKENLQETQYEKYISDQEQMLDALYDETEEWMNARLDDENLLLENILAAINNNAGLITDTLEGVAFGAGTSLPTELTDSLNQVDIYNHRAVPNDIYTQYLAQAQNVASQLQFSLPSLATYDANVATSRRVGDITINGLSLEFPNVQTPDEWVTYLQHDKRFENIILEITDGNNSLSKYKW